MGPKNSSTARYWFLFWARTEKNVIQRPDIYSNARTVNHDGQHRYLVPLTPYAVVIFISFPSLLMCWFPMSYLLSSPFLSYLSCTPFLPFHYPVPNFISCLFLPHSILIREMRGEPRVAESKGQPVGQQNECYKLKTLFCAQRFLKYWEKQKKIKLKFIFLSS